MHLEPGAVLQNEVRVGESYRIGLAPRERAHPPVPERQVGGHSIEQANGRNGRRKLPSEHEPARVGFTL